MMTASLPVTAQGIRGTISGQVTDTTGAAVQGATVKLFDVQKKIEIRTVQTGEDGRYQFLEIEPTVYDLKITASGFQEQRLTNIKVETNRNLTVDASLGVAGTSDTVNVTAGQELVDRETPTLGTTVENRRVEGLPLNGRNPLALALLQPGVYEANINSNDTFGEGAGIR